MVRAKFIVGNKVENTEAKYVTIYLQPVYSDDPNSENKKFWDYTPAGSINLSTTNLKAAEYFETGKEYYVDFTEANNG